ncbi:hypothetical protein KSS87_020934 [Heliosperma pusillum]|nr:hypothetical protein KSS87_020934 [Heliosperma pusillum]
MSRVSCDFRWLLLIAAAAFIYIQMRLFASQSNYADRLAAASGFALDDKDLIFLYASMDRSTVYVLKAYMLLVEAELQCTKQTRLFIDQINEKKRREEEVTQLRALVQSLDGRGHQQLTEKIEVPVAAIVVMACNRADYLERTIKSILKYHSNVASKYPLFISQDGPDPNVKRKALTFDQVTYMQHLDHEAIHTERPGELIAYYKIARRSIMAVSSWNDNGQKQFVHDPHVLYRSDFFPGLGWMLSKTTWDELSPKWPKAYPSCVCFLLSDFIAAGSSLGQFFSQYLEPIKLNDVNVNWKSMDLSYLMEDNYLKYFASLVQKATPLYGNDFVLKANNVDGDVRIQYKDQGDFENIARHFGIFEEWKDGIPRAAYKGVVVFRYLTSKRVYLVGPDSLKQLGLEKS